MFFSVTNVTSLYSSILYSTFAPRASQVSRLAAILLIKRSEGFVSFHYEVIFVPLSSTFIFALLLELLVVEPIPLDYPPLLQSMPLDSPLVLFLHFPPQLQMTTDKEKV